MIRFFIFPVLMIFLIIVASTMMVTERYENWDFMDLPNWCGRKRRSPLEEEDDGVIAGFGGIPNQSQVWGLGQSGCGCAKVFH